MFVPLMLLDKLIRFVVHFSVAAAWATALPVLAYAGEIPPAERRSGYDFMSRETRAMQDDDTANPGLLWVLEGEALWKRKAGQAGRACVDCHGEARERMKGVAARYPAFDPARARPINLEQRINLCRTDQQAAPPLAYESRELLALTAYIARQSRGRPRRVSAAPGPAQSGLPSVSRRPLGATTGRERHSPRTPDGVSALSAGVAGPRLAPAAAP